MPCRSRSIFSGRLHLPWAAALQTHHRSWTLQLCQARSQGWAARLCTPCLSHVFYVDYLSHMLSVIYISGVCVCLNKYIVIVDIFTYIIYLHDTFAYTHRIQCHLYLRSPAHLLWHSLWIFVGYIYICDYDHIIYSCIICIYIYPGYHTLNHTSDGAMEIPNL